MAVIISLAVVFGTAGLASFLLTGAVMALARRRGLMAVPRRSKDVHTVPLPRVGGVAMYGAFAAAILATFLVDVGRTQDELPRVVGLLLGATAAVLIGFADDLRELSAPVQLVGQIAVAAVATAFGIVALQIINPFGGFLTFPYALALAFTLLWFVGMINTVNWVDGLDGLAAGVVAIAALTLFARSFSLGQYSIAALTLALAGCAIGFLPWNFHPARILMGSSGTYLLGFALAALAIIGGAKVATALLVLGIPILDVAWVIAARVARRRAPWQGGDNRHLHRRLFDRGLSQPKVVLLFYGLCAVFGALALVLSPIPKLYAMVGVVVVLAAILVAIGERALKK